MKQYAKINQDGALTTTAIDDGDVEKTAKILEMGYLPYELPIAPTAGLQPYEKYVATHRQEDGNIVTYLEVVSNDPSLIQAEIDSLSAQLTATDWINGKCIAYIGENGLDMNNLYEVLLEKYPEEMALRAETRTRINELEQLIDDEL